MMRIIIDLIFFRLNQEPYFLEEKIGGPYTGVKKVVHEGVQKGFKRGSSRESRLKGPSLVPTVNIPLNMHPHKCRLDITQ